MVTRNMLVTHGSLPTVPTVTPKEDGPALAAYLKIWDQIAEMEIWDEISTHR